MRHHLQEINLRITEKLNAIELLPVISALPRASRAGEVADSQALFRGWHYRPIQKVPELIELAMLPVAKATESHLKVMSSPASSNLAIVARPTMAIRLLAITSFPG